MRIISIEELAVVSGGAGTQTVEVTGKKLVKPIDPVFTPAPSNSGVPNSDGTGGGLGALIVKGLDNKLPGVIVTADCSVSGSSKTDSFEYQCKVHFAVGAGNTSNLPRQAEK